MAKSDLCNMGILTLNIDLAQWLRLQDYIHAPGFKSRTSLVTVFYHFFDQVISPLAVFYSLFLQLH